MPWSESNENENVVAGFSSNAWNGGSVEFKDTYCQSFQVSPEILYFLKHAIQSKVYFTENMHLDIFIFISVSIVKILILSLLILMLFTWLLS
jgi:hypothetical protein